MCVGCLYEKIEMCIVSFDSIIKLYSVLLLQRVSVMHMTDMEMTEWDTQVNKNLLQCDIVAFVILI